MSADFRAARAALAAGSKSFALAGKLLPRDCRDDAAVVYAFCRRADDLIDLASPGDPIAAVGRLRAEVGSLFAGEPQPDPMLATFQQVAQRRRLPIAYVHELIEGLASDARPRPIVFASMDELYLYAYRVAGVVGLMMCRVMGTRDERCLRNAAALGMAMQLTNIARDVQEDWDRGRIYVPASLLPRPLTPGGTLDAQAREAFAGALPKLLAEADRLYALGDQGLRALDFRSAIAIRTARLVYSTIGSIVARRRHDVTAGRAVVSLPRKLWLLARAALETTLARMTTALVKAWRHPPAPSPPRELSP